MFDKAINMLGYGFKLDHLCLESECQYVYNKTVFTFYTCRRQNLNILKFCRASYATSWAYMCDLK